MTTKKNPSKRRLVAALVRERFGPPPEWEYYTRPVELAIVKWRLAKKRAAQ